MIGSLNTYRYLQNYAPEWGSGGIFGLRYWKGVLYFTLAFEAEAHFVKNEEETIYKFEYIGQAPRSGGDTYNAVTSVDEYIYFGGWIHAPITLSRDGKLLFTNKYSHVHVYNVYEDNVKLLWKETISAEMRWAGEVSEIIYDPISDKLLLARADGHENLGVYELDRDGKDIKKISEDPALKGTLYLEYVCFNTGKRVFNGIQCLDMYRRSWHRYEIRNKIPKISVDGHGVTKPKVGSFIVAYNRIFIITRGGIFIANPVDSEYSFIRLMDFGSIAMSPIRTNALNLGGGVLTAFNAYAEASSKPYEDVIVSPTLLIYISPPIAKIVGVLGCRVTSMESIGNSILIAANTMPNLADKSTPIDTGLRDIISLNIDTIITSSPPPLSIVLRGKYVGNSIWGGVPLNGYGDSKIIIRASKDNELTIYEYNISMPLSNNIAEKTKYAVKCGKNVIDLSSHYGILSFKFKETDFKADICMHLT